jgi:hypothetical protein
VEAVETLARITREFDLELVHWCQYVRVSWDDPLFPPIADGRGVRRMRDCDQGSIMTRPKLMWAIPTPNSRG